MTDTLRTRIAAVFEAAALRDAGYSGDDLFRLADAVIRELNLTREYSIAENDGSRVLWLDDEKPITPRQGEIVEMRWITDWTPQ